MDDKSKTIALALSGGLLKDLENAHKKAIELRHRLLLGMFATALIKTVPPETVKAVLAALEVEMKQVFCSET